MAKVTVRHRFIKEAPRKIRLVADTVRGLPAQVAVHELALLPKVAQETVRKLIVSGMAAAKEQGLNPDSLSIAGVTVDEGPKLRRFIPLSRGRSQRILKQMSHLNITLTDEPVVLTSSRAYRREQGPTANKPGKRVQAPTIADHQVVKTNQSTSKSEQDKGSK